MAEEIAFQKVLKDIVETQSYEKLDFYCGEQVWQSLAQDDQELLVNAFICAGEVELKRPTSEVPVHMAKKLFQTASSLRPLDAIIWYRRGSAFLGRGEPVLLEEASLCFDKATILNPAFFDAWHAWANLLTFRGSLSGETSYFELAEEKFKKAHSLIEGEGYSDFFWHYGLFWFTVANSSNEAYDYHIAIKYFKMAKERGLSTGEFLNDFANAYVALFLLINNQEMLYEAIDLYLCSLEVDEDNSENVQELANRYCNLGCCYQYLFEIERDGNFFNQAQSCFGLAIQQQSNCYSAWLAWGTLLLFASKLWQDVVHLRESIEKFSRAAEFHSDNPFLLAHWSEALAHFGYHEDDLALLVESEKLANRAVEIAPQISDVWFASAFVSYQMGRYFSDQAHLLKACEKAGQGLSLNQEHGQLLHLLAVAKFALGEIDDDMKLFEEALICFHRASGSEFNRMGCFWYDWGIAFLNVSEITQDPRHVQEAIEKFERAILLQETTDLDWLLNYASALDLLGDLTDDESLYERAIQMLTHIVATEPENIAARYQLALSMSHLGELTSDLEAYEKAIELLQKVVEDDPEDEHAWNDLGFALMNIAEMVNDSPSDEALKTSLYEIALQNFMRAIHLGNQHGLYYIACLYSLQGDLSTAIEYLERALENNTLPPVEDVMEDNWLQGLKGTPYFERFLKRLAMQRNDI